MFIVEEDFRSFTANIGLCMETISENLRSSLFSEESIHIWMVKVGSQLFEVAATSTLSSDERLCAERYQNAESRSRFIKVRSALRKLLGGYLQLPPQLINSLVQPITVIGSGS